MLLTRSIDPLRLVAILLIGGGAVAWLSSSRRAAGDAACPPGRDGCAVETSTATSRAAPPTVAAPDFCRDVGYLCAGLEESDAVRLHRWRDFDGTVVVHVPLPDHLEPAAARSLQRAAARGVRAWNDQPFPVLVDQRGDRDPHFAVRWTPSMSGGQLGLTRTRWSPRTGLEVESIELGTSNPGSPGRSAAARQIRLTAAHEMGHALGLPHSDSPRDVMYPTNTATSMSAQDYRSIEVLYATADGTTITR